MSVYKVLQINFEEADYSFDEDRQDFSSPIFLQFRRNQNPFTVILSTVSIKVIENEGLGDFVNLENIGNLSRATPGICKHVQVLNYIMIYDCGTKLPKY